MHVKRTRSIFSVQEYHLEAVQEKKIVWVFVNMKKKYLVTYKIRWWP